ncbi:hypothetical protein GII30_15035 [Gordonia amarae]|uniref:Secreted protein n=2 Tax=Gordonia amarae TaxID=36821 RepID=G7GJV9_9ACTN|nr:hypothetical protein [Gordonia amarae]MCS3879719.1 hypothetical protein [Gordonia amarae]QHN18157.1 hypothetical protein GII35_15350 [Gordonia amarae]QHN31544.1 hypothetical protein GII32_15200 [Gordonia amarae]QHN40288.1 hypothetical protein GII30_15035 [Gordonia amarae]GAB03884.1 hypothetical protein GOAMR_06_00900 [Gordonia amarae NBRC 15530]
MKNMKNIVAATALAGAAAGALALGTGTAAADTAGVPDGHYVAEIVNPVPPVTSPPVATVPVTVRDGVLSVAGLSGRLAPTADGARTTLAGQSVGLHDGENGIYSVTINGSTWAHLR